MGLARPWKPEGWTSKHSDTEPVRVTGGRYWFLESLRVSSRFMRPPHSMRRRFSARDLALVALFAAVMVVLGLVPLIPLPGVPAPFTSQTLGVMLAGGILGRRRGFFSIALFVLLVAVGLPVLPNGRGGMGPIVGVTGGFILAYPLGAYVTGFLTELWWRRLTPLSAWLACAAGGALTLYIIGIPWMAMVGKLPWAKAWLASVVFLPGDAIKITVATVAVLAVRKAYPLIRPAQPALVTQPLGAAPPASDTPPSATDTSQ